MNPWLTVAIPTYRGERHVAHAIRSVLNQKTPGSAPELLVVDDRSDDATIERAREAAGDRARIEINAERLGLAGNWNRCVDLANTPWVAVFHQDDVMQPDHLAHHHQCLNHRADLGFICGAFDVFDDAGRPVSSRTIERVSLGRSRVFEAGQFVAELSGRNPVRCSTVTLNKAAHQAVGGFDPAWKYVVDWEFWFRVAQRYAVAWIDTPTVQIRWHAASETSRLRQSLADLEEVEALLGRIQQVGSSPLVRRQSDRRLARAYLNRAYEAASANNTRLARQALDRASRLDRLLWLRIARAPRVLWKLLRLRRQAGKF